MAYLEKIIHVLSRWLNWIAVGALLGMMLLASANMILRVPGEPIKGTYEIVGYLGAFVVSFALSQTQVRKGHVSVRIVTSRLSSRIRAILDTGTYLLATSVFALIAWQVAKFGSRIWLSGQQSESLFIVFGPIIVFTSIGCACMCLVLLLDFLKSLAQVRKK